MNPQMSFDEYVERAPYVRDSETSREAAEAIKPSLPYLRSIVLSAIRRSGDAGLTDNEGITETGIQGSTYRPRRRELEDAGLIVDSGGRRVTHGSTRQTKCVVWIVKERA